MYPDLEILCWCPIRRVAAGYFSENPLTYVISQFCFAIGDLRLPAHYGEDVMSLCGLLVVGSVAATVVSRTITVDVRAREGGDGSEARPFSTPYQAFAAAQSGDRIVVRAGTYVMPSPLRLEVGGTESDWLEIVAAPGAMPVLDFATWKPASNEAFSRGALEILGPAYVRIQGLRINNSHAFGISVRGPSHHIDLLDCRVDNTFCPGIGVWNAEQVRVARNEVTRATTNRMRLYGDASREAPHEAISIAGVNGFEVIGNHVHHCDKEGIDVKEVSRNGVVHANWVHDMPRQGLYADAWFGLLENVEFIGNISERNEWGAVISVEGRTSRLKNVTLRHNLIRDCRASGIHFGIWGQNAYREGIRIESNTVLRCGKIDHWSGTTGGIDLRSPFYRDVVVTKNLVLDNPVFGIGADVGPGPVAQERALVVQDNWVFPWRPVPDVESPYGKVVAWPAEPVHAAAVRLDQAGWFPLDPVSAREYGALRAARGTLPKGKSPLVGFPELGPLKGLPRQIAP